MSTAPDAHYGGRDLECSGVHKTGKGKVDLGIAIEVGHDGLGGFEQAHSRRQGRLVLCVGPVQLEVVLVALCQAQSDMRAHRMAANP